VNAVHNPMNVQFWLWGLDAQHGDLEARGFRKAPRPTNTATSVYACDGLHLHGYGLWLHGHPALPGQVLVYCRPRKTWYVLPEGSTLCPEHFTRPDAAWCAHAAPRKLSPPRALALIRPAVSAYERWLSEHRGAQWRTAQLERIGSRAVRRARRTWTAWLEDAT
jgi:hypothetical protein